MTVESSVPSLQSWSRGVGGDEIRKIAQGQMERLWTQGLDLWAERTKQCCSSPVQQNGLRCGKCSDSVLSTTIVAWLHFLVVVVVVFERGGGISFIGPEQGWGDPKEGQGKEWIRVGKLKCNDVKCADTLSHLHCSTQRSICTVKFRWTEVSFTV